MQPTNPTDDMTPEEREYADAANERAVEPATREMGPRPERSAEERRERDLAEKADCEDDSENMFGRMMDAQRGGTGVVVLGVEAPHVATTLEAAREMAEARFARIKGGERVAWLYPSDHVGAYRPSTDHDWQLCTGVTSEEARQLLALGAKWIGAEVDRP